MNKKQIEYYNASELRGHAKDVVVEALRSYDGHSHEFAAPAVDALIPVSQRSGAVILDCGTADGSFIDALWDLGFRHICACDIDDYRSDTVKAHQHTEKFCAFDFSHEQSTWNDHTFDVITAWCIIPHLENPFHFLREIVRIIKPSGTFIVSAPYLGSMRARKKMLFTAELDRYSATNNHITIVTETLLKKALQAKFELKSKRYFIDEKIYRSRFGRIKRLLCETPWKYRERMRAIFGVNVIYEFVARPAL
ncbi:MAG: class I SAM-dependent methyltransferase [Patescibacteria group bacterium]